MCIDAAVGALAPNRLNDVKTIQILVNFSTPPPMRLLDVDGICGRQTIDTIHAFQTRTMGMVDADGRVDRGGRTLRASKQAVPQNGFFPGHLHGIALAAGRQLVERFHMPLQRHMANYGIDTPRRRAHFLAQVCHESAQLRYTEEIASGAAYEGRVDLGNTQPGDGRRFKGRGLIQLTGRANYVAFGQALGRNFTTDANAALLATDPDLATQVACWFWSTRALNGPADANDLRRITLRINGGLNGYGDRQALYARAACMFNLP